MSEAACAPNPLLRATPIAEQRWGATGFVWSIWALAVLAGLGFVFTFGSNVPFWDEWSMVPVWTGEQPVTLSWLWSQHNEHRLALPRLILLGLFQLTNWDFRSGMVANVLLLGLLALGMIQTAKSLRGRISYGDAFFPLVLLHWGHCDNLLWGWQIQFVLSAVLAGGLLCLIVCWGLRLTPWAAALAGVLLVALPLCGANGLALVPALGLWLGYLGLRQLRSPARPDKWIGLVMLVGVVVALGLVPLYFLGYDRPVYHGYSHTLSGVGSSALHFLSGDFGPVADRFWPLSGFGELVLLLPTMILLAAVSWRCPAERSRALGLLAFFAALASLALGLGWGRADGSLRRYVTLAVPVLCAIYFTWLLYCPRSIRDSLTLCLCVLVGLLCVVNTKTGLTVAKNRRDKMVAFERDLNNKVPLFLLVKRHAPFLLLSQEELFADYLRTLHQHGCGPFQNLQEDPPFAVVELKVRPTTCHEMQWHNGTGEGTGSESYLDVTLPRSRFIYRLHLGYSHANPEGTWPSMQVCWKRAAQTDFPPNQRFACHYLETGNDKAVTVVIADTIDQIRIYPDNKPCVFQVRELKLEVPVPGGRTAGP